MRKFSLPSLLIGISLACIASAAPAMGILRADDNLVMYGKVLPEDLSAFEQELTHGDVHTIIFANSPGGDLKSAYGIAKLIKEMHINTAVQGHCASSCAVMFMAGTVRQMVGGGAQKTRLGFHGPHKKDSKAVSTHGIPKLREWLMQASGEKFPPELLDKAMYIEKANDMMLFYYPDGNANSVWFCPEGSKPRPTACEKMPGYDALSAGILTTATLLDTGAIPVKTDTRQMSQQEKTEIE